MTVPDLMQGNFDHCEWKSSFRQFDSTKHHLLIWNGRLLYSGSKLFVWFIAHFNQLLRGSSFIENPRSEAAVSTALMYSLSWLLLNPRPAWFSRSRRRFSSICRKRSISAFLRRSSSCSRHRSSRSNRSDRFISAIFTTLTAKSVRKFSTRCISPSVHLFRTPDVDHESIWSVSFPDDILTLSNQMDWVQGYRLTWLSDLIILPT